MRFEYQIKGIKVTNKDTMATIKEQERRLNSAGNEGWELVAATQMGELINCFFKRVQRF